MAFPDLALKNGGVFHSENTGTPTNGVNTFALAMNPDLIDNTDWLTVNVYPLGPSITGVSGLTVSGDKTQISVNFVQTGADQARVEAIYEHSITR